MTADEPIQDRLRALPEAPGVYLLLDRKGRIIYVGKAKSLRSRVRSYFAEGSGDDRRLLPFLRRHLAGFDTVRVDNEKEALLLENNLIKQHRPRYNVRLVDDKTYLSLRLDRRHPFPRFTTVRRPRPDGSRHFGPYSSARAVRSTLKLIYRTFGIRSCNDSIFANRIRPCLYYQIGQCLAPCVGYVTQTEYAEALARAELLLEGRSRELMDDLHAQMLRLADAERFEEAAVLRDQLRAVERTIEKQDVDSDRELDFDVIGHCGRGNVHAFLWLIVREGRVIDTTTVRLRDPGAHDTGELLTTVLTRSYEDRPVPPSVLVDFLPHDQPVLEQILTDRRGGRVVIRVPRRGSHRRLLGIANANAAAAIDLQARRGERDERLLAEVAALLALPGPPSRIECFDISNLGGTLTVGSMVAAIDGVPTPAEYRRYRVRSVEGGDDYGAMRELLLRRLRRARDEHEVPDLLLIDGGRGQLGVAREVARSLDLDELPIVAIAKGPERNKGREVLHLSGRDQPLTLPRDDDRLHLLQRIRDEAHRFAITYNRRLRKDRDRRSQLPAVRGLGPKRIRGLLATFGSLDAIRRASVEELQRAPGMSRNVARALYAGLRTRADSLAENNEKLPTGSG